MNLPFAWIAVTHTSYVHISLLPYIYYLFFQCNVLFLGFLQL